MKLLDFIKEPVLYLAADSEAVWGNGQLAQMLGYATEESFSAPSEQFFFPLLTSQALAAASLIDQLREKSGVECRIPRHDGEMAQVSLQIIELPFAAQESGLLIQVRGSAVSENNEIIKEESCPLSKDILDNIGEAIFLAPLSRDGVHGNFVYVNRCACKRLGYSEEELLSFNARTINPNANQFKVKTLGRSIQREGETIFEAIHVAKDGTEIPVEVTAKVIAVNGTEYVLSVVRDKREYAELNTMESRFARLVDHSWNEIYIFNSKDYRFLQANQGALNNLGYSSRELCELKLSDLEPDISETEFKQRVQPLFEGNQSQIIYETRHKRKNGSFYPVEIRLQLSYGEVPPVFLANVQDITERKKIENRLQFLANYDSLTGLPNRVLFLDRLNMAMEQSHRNERLIALLYLDLDGFKRVNDSRGHLVGDELLKQVASRLENSLRRSDTVARLGGDEFCIITGNLRRTEDIENVAHNIIKEINKPFMIKGEESRVTTSIGICYFPLSDSDDADQLMQKADAAMYRAKKLGKNNVQFYEENIGVEKSQKQSLESDLDRAITRGEFYLVYQPKINLERMEITGVEALLRWNHPEKGLIPPLDFIHILEKSGKIQAVGAWVLQQACLQVAEWNKHQHNLCLSVNVSSKQLENPQFIPVIERSLAEAGLEASNLELDIAESAISELSEKAVDRIRQVRNLGVGISLDDFGSGYSSLNYIKRLTVNSLKIDSEYISACEKNPESIVIVDSMIKLADGLHLNIIAEGIETEYQLNLLKSYGCQEGQGYYFAKPLTVDELDNKLKALSKKVS